MHKNEHAVAMRARRRVANGDDTLADLTPGNAHGFVGPVKPPSKDLDKRDARWYEDQHVSSYYCWGRVDMGEYRDANDVYKWGESWADANWEFRQHYRSSMPSMQGAFSRYFAGEAI